MKLWLVLVLFLIAGKLPAQQPSTPLPADPKKLATLEGRTLASDGNPLRKSTLTLRPAMEKAGEMPQAYTAASDAEGKFIFDGVEPGRYALMGQHAGYIQSSYGAKRNSNSGTILNLTPGQHMREVNFTLTLRAIISGRVLDDEGDPVANSQVQFLRKTYSNGKYQFFPGGYGQTDDAGEFKVSNLGPGRYYLSAAPPRMNSFEAIRKAAGPPGDSAKPEEDLVTTYYPGVTDTDSAATIEVIPGRDMPGTDIRLIKSPVFRVKGKIVANLNSDSGQRVRIMISRRDSFMMNFGPGSVVAEKDGSFELRGISPGSYSLIAATSQGMMKTLARQNIEVGTRNIEEVTLVVQPAGSLRGSVRLEQSSAPDASRPATDLSTVRFNLGVTAGISFNPNMGAVKADGTFVLDGVAADKYFLNVHSIPDGTYLKSAHLGNQDVLANGLDLTGGAGAATLDIVLSANAAQIDGSVQDDHQQPTAGTQVSLLPDPLDVTRTYLYKGISTDQNGQFSIKNIAPGKYRLYAWEDIENGSQYDPEFMKPVEALGTKITVEENGHLTQTLTRISVAQVEQAKPK